MLAQRIAQRSLRQLAAQQSTTRLAAIAAGSIVPVQRRLAATTPVSHTTQNAEILAKQRLNRPVSPHLGIYAPQISWYLSGLNRITGCLLSGGFYIFGSLYLIAPYIGIHSMTSAGMAAAFGSLPAVVKVALKALVAWPFTFHCMNGVRHLIWDTTYMITNKKVITSGWTVVALSTISALALAFM